jgi:hypothetical protein
MAGPPVVRLLSMSARRMGHRGCWTLIAQNF